MAPAQPAARGASTAGSSDSGTRARTIVGGLSDEELARRSADGDRGCFSELVSRYSDRVFGLILSRVRVRADAEEASQETFLRAWRGIKTFDPERRFAAWVMTIAHRQAIDVIRNRKRDRDRLDRERHEAQGKGGVPEPKIAEEGESVWTVARRELKPDAYEALWLRYAEDCSPQEVAKVMGKTSVWVRVTLHRSRVRLSEAMGNQGLTEQDEAPRGGESMEGAPE